MENFPEKESRGVKEKNVYLLHLDTPRIIIIASVIIGIMIISFLAGININKEGSNDNNFLQEEPLFTTTTDNKSNFEIFDEKAVNSPAIEDEIALNKASQDKASLNGKDDIIKFRDIQNRKTSITEKENAPSDILTNENIKDIIPPVKKVLKTSSKSAVKKYRKKPPSKKAGKRKMRSKERIVEVSTDKQTFPVSKNNNLNHFAIQIASYDKKSKALDEINKLERMKYNAYLEKARINGKKYYRVRIGPIFSKIKALKILNEIQVVDRYDESYMVKN